MREGCYAAGRVSAGVKVRSLFKIQRDLREDMCHFPLQPTLTNKTHQPLAPDSTQKTFAHPPGPS